MPFPQVRDPQLLQRIRTVRKQFSEKDVLVRIDRVDDDVPEFGDVGLVAVRFDVGCGIGDDAACKKA